MHDPLFSLAGQSALITGASSGFGHYFAETLAARGARVAIAARRSDRLSTLAERIRDAGGACHTIAMDVTDANSVTKGVQDAWEWSGGLDILVNNAGIGANAAFLDMTEADWDSNLDTNLKGAFLVAQQVAKHCAQHQRPASIINIASILGLRVASHLASYAASKAGLIQLTKAMALELARYNIRVNAIAPGYIETDINRDFFATTAGERMIKRIPSQRLGCLHELLGPLLLLASDASAYMTGSVITVDGGHTINTL
ncbi:Short-chain dehydrogenase/reductase SDR [gamma proteobacterium HdN1]|nr:Short-chain dehydrogenase/reductase SDR [gamma proteobacterium HdN1]